MAESKTAAKPKAQPKDQPKKYRAVDGVSRFDDRAEPGEDITFDLGNSLDWLLANGHVEEVA